MSAPPFQFRLRTLFIVVTLAGLVFAPAAVLKQREEQQEQENEAVSALKKLGGIVDYDGSGLAYVQLGRTDITDADLAQLPKLRRARYVSLYETGVTDAGLPHLLKLKHLEKLDLAHTQVTPSGIARLHKALPDVAIFPAEDRRTDRPDL